MSVRGTLVGAVLLREQMKFGLPTGYFYASDAAADEFILAHEDQKTDVLTSCLHALVKHFPSAVIFLATKQDYSHARWELPTKGTRSYARYRLKLQGGWDHTLQQFGRRSRRNLRYYARHLLKEGAAFDANVHEQDVDSAAFDLLLKSDYPTTALHLRETLATLRRTPGNYAVGLRGATGKWLSLLMGWREGSRTFVFLQINDTSRAKGSLSTALRALFIQGEISHRCSEIAFVSSSSRLIESGCTEDDQFNLFLAKRTLRRWLISLFAARSLPEDHRLRRVLAE